MILPAWTEARLGDVGLEPAQLEKACDCALSVDGSGYIIWYGRPINVTTLGLAMADGKIGLADNVIKHHPALTLPP